MSSSKNVSYFIIFIGHKSEHCLPLSLTHSLTAVWYTWLMLRVKMPNSKLVDVVTVADVDGEERVGNSLVEILTLKIVQDIEAEIWSRFWSWGSVDILKPKFGQDFEVEAQLIFWSRSLVKILRLKFGPDCVAQDCSTFWGWSLVKILKVKLGQDSEGEVGSRFWGCILTNLWPNLKAVILVKARNPWVRFVFNKFFYTTDVCLHTVFYIVVRPTKYCGGCSIYTCLPEFDGSYYIDNNRHAKSANTSTMALYASTSAKCLKCHPGGAQEGGGDEGLRQVTEEVWLFWKIPTWGHLGCSQRSPKSPPWSVWG